MNDVLKGKVILVVDDEQDVLDTVEEVLDICIVHKAKDNKTAHQYLSGYTYDIVILDIMGVEGFDLLKHSVRKGFPTVMLTAHALNPEAIKKSIKLGAVFFIPKEKLPGIEEFLAEVVLNEGRPIWKKLFSSFGNYLNSRFGPDWREKDRFFKEFEESLRGKKADNQERL